MPRNGQKIKLLKPGHLVRGRDIAPIIELCNALTSGKIVSGSSNELIIGDLAMLWKIKGGLPGQQTTGGSYRGEYSPDGSTTFNPGDFQFGDIVRVSPTNANAAPTGSIIPGVYICIQDAPTESDLPNHQLSPGGETAFWHWLSTWPSLTTRCATDGSSVNVFSDEQDSNA